MTTYEQIQQALRMIEHSAMSWDGYFVFGDHKSIKKVRALVETANNAEIFRKELLELREKVREFCK